MARTVLIGRGMIATRSSVQSSQQPRFVQTFVGRLLELMVYSVEGIRERLGRQTLH